MNRRSFLSFFALAPLAAVTAGAAAAEIATVTIIAGADFGADGSVTVCIAHQNLKTFELEFIEARTFSVEDIARFYRVPLDQIGRLA